LPNIYFSKGVDEMRILRFLFAIALACGLSLTAKADSDFRMIVIDPPGYLVTPITDFSTFSISFSPCVSPGQIPSGSGFDGCFSFQNETTAPITSLEVSVNGLVPNQTAGCTPFGSGLDIYSTATCSDLPAGYLLDFSGGAIAIGQIVTIAEQGVDPADFPPTTVTPFGAPTPEPSSFILLATGALSAGSMLRRRMVRTTGK
jgi:hypothetical protein